MLARAPRRLPAARRAGADSPRRPGVSRSGGASHADSSAWRSPQRSSPRSVAAFLVAPTHARDAASCRRTRPGSSSSTCRRACARRPTTGSSRRSRRSQRRRAGSASYCSRTSPTRHSRPGTPAAGTEADAPLLRAADVRLVGELAADRPNSPGSSGSRPEPRISSGLYLAAHMLQQQHVRQQRGDADQRPRRRSDRPEQARRTRSSCSSRRKVPLEIVGARSHERERQLLQEPARDKRDLPGSSATERRAGPRSARGHRDVRDLACRLRRARDRHSRAQRVVGRAIALAPEDRVIRRLAAAGAMLAVAALLVLLARDVWHWQRAVGDADARAAIAPISPNAWQANTTLPWRARTPIARNR